MLGQADKSDEVTSRRPNLIDGVFAAQEENRGPHMPLLGRVNLRPGFSNSYTQHRATASRMVFFQAEIRSRHVLITDERHLSEEILSSSDSWDGIRCTPGGGG